MKLRIDNLISTGALVALAGYVMSGPVSFLAVNLAKPQPPWISSASFAENYSSIQDLPFYFGFLLIGGMLMLSAGHVLSNSEEDAVTKHHLLLAFGCTTIFCTLIAFNYITQITFIHNLATHYKPEYDEALAIFSMANPMSLCWAIEMWGYAMLGIATLLLARFYRSKKSIIRLLLIINGIVSLLSAVWTIIDVHWLMTPYGIIAYFVWNVLMIVLMVWMYLYAKRQVS